MKLIKHSAAIQILAAIALSTQLTACVPIILGGAAAGGIMAADRRTSGIYLEDQNIELKASKNIDDQIGKDIHFNIVSYNRNVLITGEVINEVSKTKAEGIIKRTDNVRSVTNELIIGPKSELGSRSNDAFLTTKVKTRILASNRFPTNHVKVVTENSVVYLMGIVSRKEAEDAADIARDTDGVQKVVKVFEYLD
jgi:osmotically-inducible protein OsmY